MLIAVGSRYLMMNPNWRGEWNRCSAQTEISFGELILESSVIILFLSIPGADTDLSSVTKMMDATDPLNFKGFFKSGHPEEPTITAPHLAPIAHSKNVPGLLQHPGLQIPSDYAKAIHRELDNLQKEGDVDESALSQVREMALSVKEECATTSTGGIPRPILPADSPKGDSLKDVRFFFK